MRIEIGGIICRMEDKKVPIICSWILDFACGEVWREMKDSLSVSSSECWLHVIQVCSEKIIDSTTLSKWEPFRTICSLCQLLCRARLLLEDKELSGTPDEVHAAVDAARTATTRLTSLSKECDEGQVRALVRQLEVMIVLGEVRIGETDKARDRLTWLLENDSDGDRDVLSSLHEEISKSSNMSTLNIKTLMTDHSYRHILSMFVEVVSPVVDSYSQPVLSQYVEEYISIASEKQDIDFLPLSHLYTVFNALHKDHGNSDVPADEQWDRDVLGQASKQPVTKKASKKKRLTRKRRKPDNSDINDSDDVDDASRTEEYKRMRDLVDMSKKLRMQVVDPLDEPLDSSDHSSKDTAANRLPVTTQFQLTDSPGVAMGWDGSEKRDERDENEDSHVTKPLVFPRIKYRHRDSLELPQTKPVIIHKKKWSRDEEDNLKRGVRDLGVGNWAAILHHFKFQSHRTAVSLKDKWRNLMKAGDTELDDSD